MITYSTDHLPLPISSSDLRRPQQQNTSLQNGGRCAVILKRGVFSRYSLFILLPCARGIEEALINSALRLHASALSSRRRQILSVALATPAVCLLERYSAST